jgi:hypothetical protein
MNPGRYRFVVAFLLLLAGVINYMDRAALGVVAPLVQKDLELSPSELGVVSWNRRAQPFSQERQLRAPIIACKGADIAWQTWDF